MTSNFTINIAQDFSDVPSGRFPEDGPFNGQLFRERFLVPVLKRSEVVDVVLDNAEGYGSSFLEEAFAGLVRVNHFKKDFLKKHLHLMAKTVVARHYKSVIEGLIEKAKPDSSVTSQSRSE
ncbi:hypothetical protein FHW84_003773 [Dyella sp. SG562]|uniref:STAS-like domain-containing protein n=1 Tax=Dyella sp. SG562 TaxID=2587017 RepID=UPI001420D2B8|nr:STAS-like domain-containing protein [Dyella sp. SG562]NII75175.1 hypothetical protein [Dyella sp. SG562]